MDTEWFITVTISKGVMEFPLERQVSMTKDIVDELMNRLILTIDTKVSEVTKNGHCHWHMLVRDGDKRSHQELEKLIKSKLRQKAFKDYLGYVFDIRAVWDREYLLEVYFKKQNTNVVTSVLSSVPLFTMVLDSDEE